MGKFCNEMQAESIEKIDSKNLCNFKEKSVAFQRGRLSLLLETFLLY